LLCAVEVDIEEFVTGEVFSVVVVEEILVLEVVSVVECVSEEVAVEEFVTGEVVSVVVSVVEIFLCGDLVVVEVF
jgi:hypothetical protein